MSEPNISYKGLHESTTSRSRALALNTGHASKGMITGFAVIAEMCTGGLLMENMKMERQRTTMTYGTLFKRCCSHGMRGAVAGMWPWGLMGGFTKGSVLGASKSASLSLCNAVNVHGRNAQIASGFMAGAAQGAALAPLMLARNIVNEGITATGSANGQTARRGATLSQVLREMRARGATTGVGTLAARRSLDWGARFAVVEALAPSGDKNVSQTQRAAAAFVAGMMTSFVTTPIDRLVPLIQGGDMKGKRGITQLVQERVREEGFRTMFRGSLMRCMHTGYHTLWATVLADCIFKWVSKE